MTAEECALCRGAELDAELGRELVWESDLWRLTTSIGPGDPTPGFSYLEPKRHITDITELDGEEALTFGPVVARSCQALKEATGAELVYIYVFGDSVPHLHLHLAPHSAGDALVETPLRGEFEEKALPSGHIAMLSKDFPAVPDDELHAAAARARAILRASGRPE
jgi:diadenosine tetraphosphate (Ap4A) HIT family hydrolase